MHIIHQHILLALTAAFILGAFSAILGLWAFVKAGDMAVARGLNL